MNPDTGEITTITPTGHTYRSKQTPARGATVDDPELPITDPPGG